MLRRALIRSRALPSFNLLLFGLLMSAGLRAQGKIQGQVLNETLHRPVANLEVRLLSPKGGMQEVATAMTDRDGRFFFGPEEIDPSAFYLVETRFQDVNYHAPAPFDPTGAATINLTVDESTRSDPGLRVQTLRILVRAEGTKIRVRKDYMVRNRSEEHTSELQSRLHLVCRLLLEKKKNKIKRN